MPIKRLKATDFLVFKGAGAETGKPSKTFTLDFCPGINIIMGGNGVGKTSILKMLYAACEWSNRKADPGKTKRLADYFGLSTTEDKLTTFDSKRGSASYRVESENNAFEWDTARELFTSDWEAEKIQSVFIPTMEMLSHAKGFLALNEKFDMPFDRTQVDIIVNAELPETREVSDLNLRLLDQISKVIDGEVVFEDDAFYIRKSSGHKIEFSLEAEGFRKFALLWKLLRNGLLNCGSILFWDEPEANINPELIPLLVEILFELQRGGVQVFLATHSYNLARYFDVTGHKSDSIRYFLLHKEGPEILSTSAARYTDMERNPIELAGEKLFQAVVARASEDAADEN